MNWPVSTAWVERWKRFEQSGIYARRPYKCPAGFTTIGWGRNLDGKGISEDEADYMLANDIKEGIAALDAQWPWWRDQPADVRGVLLDMCMNMGMSTLATFKAFPAALKAKQYQTAAVEMLDSKWAWQVGQRAEELAEIVRNASADH